MQYQRAFIGELIGTFILVLFGCGSVATAILFDAHKGLFDVAIIWGIGVTLAIYATRHLSCAHLNPAVSIAMVLGKRMSPKQLPTYIIAQFIGAFIAAATLYVLFYSSIANYESVHGIVRGTPASIKTAMMFGEYYPNPGMVMAKVSYINAFLAEGIGTFILIAMIFALTEGCNVGRPDDRLAPLFIGLTVTVLICLLAPLTQAGINPARDLAPRLFAWLAGWRDAAFPDSQYGFIVIYVISPIFGGTIASLLFVKIIEPIMSADKNKCGGDMCLK
ncbi:MAG: aquaporin family protein [Victivallaceae bacterium]|nr:aquaporin family protein [Victivallaceae bacterium]